MDSVGSVKGPVTEFVEATDQGLDLITQPDILEQLAFDLANRIGDGRVVAIQQAADLGKRCVGVAAAQVHRELPRNQDVATT